uniref:Uncharacterized protein n=1 Tax=Anguilla anguilla TaxID=7936 RepID=A0A0E9U118_ANGAN
MHSLSHLMLYHLFKNCLQQTLVKEFGKVELLRKQCECAWGKSIFNFRDPAR